MELFDAMLLAFTDIFREKYRPLLFSSLLFSVGASKRRFESRACDRGIWIWSTDRWWVSAPGPESRGDGRTGNDEVNRDAPI
jgi:hypothetical protein